MKKKEHNTIFSHYFFSASLPISIQCKTKTKINKKYFLIYDQYNIFHIIYTKLTKAPPTLN